MLRARRSSRVTNEGVSRPKKVEQDLEFGAAAAAGAAGLFSADDVAAGCLQRATLQAEVLVDRRDAGIAVGRHGGVSSVSEASRCSQGIVSEFLQQLYWDGNFVSSLRLGWVDASEAAIQVKIREQRVIEALAVVFRHLGGTGPVFAPKVAKPQIKATEGSTSRLAPHRSTLVGDRLGHDPGEQALFLQRTIGNQATLRYLTQRLSDPPVKGPAERHEQEVALEDMTGREAPRGPSWDFSKIPVFPPDRAFQPHPSSPVTPRPLPGAIQAKLAVGQLNDPLEHEADRVADQVMRMPGAQPSVAPVPSQLSRKCAACEEEDAHALQSRSAGQPVSAPAAPAPSIVHGVLRSPGQPLDLASRAFFEPRFGQDFGAVRVHVDAHAAASARSVGALAHTVGSHLVFAEGRVREPTAEPGRHLSSPRTCSCHSAGRPSPSRAAR